MTITAIPPLDRTAATFRADCDAYFATSIPNFTTEINALALDLAGRQDTASKAAASATESATTATSKAAEAGTSAGSASGSAKSASDSAAAAAASAATVGLTAAFSDANPMLKNAADNSKQGIFKADLISTGVVREWQLPDRNGRLALLDDTALVLLASLVPAANALTIDFLNVFTPAYDNYLVLVRTMEGSLAGGDNIGFRFAVAGMVDAGSKYLPGPSASSGVPTNPQTQGYALGRLYTAPQFGKIEIHNANGTNTVKGWSSQAYVMDQTNTPSLSEPYGFYLGASAVSGFRLFIGGTYSRFLAKGSIEVYGYKKVMG